MSSIHENLLILGSAGERNFSKVKDNYRDLIFIWHPDRQPERLKKKANDMLRRLNLAFEYIQNHQEELAIYRLDAHLNRSKKKTSTPQSGYLSLRISCPHCGGSGRVLSNVNRQSQYEFEACPICLRHGYIFVDNRNKCLDCKGSGKNKKNSREARSAFIHNNLSKMSHLSSLQRARLFRRLWVQYSREVEPCGSCTGAGYFYYQWEKRLHKRTG